MAARVVENLSELKKLVGQELAVTDYVEVTQDRIDKFADTTGDHQWIHVNLERARKESPYKTTIAHGFLTLSLMSSFMASGIQVNGVRMAVNYGLDRVRFPAPVPCGSKIRARIALQSLEEIQGGVQAKWGIQIECEGAPKPSCAAEWLVRYYS